MYGRRKRIASYLIALSLIPAVIGMGKFLGNYENKRQIGKIESRNIEWVETKVTKGMTLWGYASRYASKLDVRTPLIIDEIIKENGLESKTLQEGQRLKVPKID